MTKNNLVDQVSQATQRTKKETEPLVEAVLTSISAALLQGEKVDLRGFGNFQVRAKKERQGRNPRTGETTTIAARKVAVFKPSKELAGRLNGTPGSEADTGAQPSSESLKLHGDKLDV